MDQQVWKVGELAKRTGVSVRTLHYYDEIGLLTPSRRSGTGYRLYVAEDVMRLQQIKSLRQLGFSLSDVRDFLNRPDYAPQDVIQMHIARLRQQIALQQKLCDRLEGIAQRFNEQKNETVEQFIETVKELEMVEKFAKYYTPDQLEELRQRGEEIGPERIRQAEGEWAELIQQVRTEMSNGTDPADPRMQALAQHWQKLITEFTGGNDGIAKSLANMYRQEPDIASEHGYTHDPGMAEYVGKALSAAKGKP